MEYAVNELGRPVIYIINYSYMDHHVRDEYFVQAIATLPEAKVFAERNSSYEIVEQDMITGEKIPFTFIKKQQEMKEALVSLYKSGFKRETFDSLEVRKPFQNQLNFPLAPELAKAEKKQSQAALPA